MPRQDPITIKMVKNDIDRMNRINYTNLLENMQDVRVQRDVLDREDYEEKKILDRYQNYINEERIKRNESEFLEEASQSESEKEHMKSKFMYVIYDFSLTNVNKI